MDGIPLGRMTAASVLPAPPLGQGLRVVPLWYVAAGMLAGSLLGTAWPLSLSALSGGLLLLGVGLSLPLPAAPLRHSVRLGLLGVALTALQLAWQGRDLPAQHLVHLLPSLPTHVTIEGTLVRPVETRDGHQYVVLALQRLEHEAGGQSVSGLVRLHVHTAALALWPGDLVRVSRVRLQRVHSAQNPGGFDFARMMRRRGIEVVGGVSNPERLHMQARPAGFRLDRCLEQWRQQLRAEVQTLLPAPYAAVFLAMVLGQRSDLPATVEQSFRAAGTTHLLVVSGLNVSCIALALLWFWRLLLRHLRGWLPRAWVPGWRPTPLAALLSLPPVLLYCGLVGWEIPATRAALMVGSTLLALIVQRPREPLHALVLAAALTLLLEPGAACELAFQLSFVAVAAIFLVARVAAVPAAASCLARWRQRLRVYVLVNSAAYFGTLPLLAGAFHTVPTFAILANLPLLPLASLVTQAGVAALVLLVGWPALAPYVFAPLLPLLTWAVRIPETVAAWPAAQWYCAAPSLPMLLGYYGLLGSLFLGAGWNRRWTWAGGAALLLLAGAGWQYMASRPAQLQVTFLDVGSGDAIVVRSPGYQPIMIDGGGTYDGRFDIGAQVVAPFLWEQYIRRFDLMVLTHMHPDHARGLGSVLRLFPSQHLLTNGTPMFADYLHALRLTAQRHGTRQHSMPHGPRLWQWGQLRLTVLTPPLPDSAGAATWTPRNENDRSLVLRLEYGEMRMLLTGDIEQATEHWLLAQGLDLRADILKIPHHGSKTSTSAAFVQQVQPRVGIISTGAGNPYGHPHPRVLDVLHQQGVEIWRTDLHGAITVHSDGRNYQIRAFRPHQALFPGATPRRALGSGLQEPS
ncbi:MAG: DNA internalization-related competence protein ComEC/Rec2 [Candidatus Tectimicrobiota bacterium]